MTDPAVHRLAAFTDDPAGGNPAGVVVTDEPLPAERMQAIAAEVGFSETAFLVPRRGEERALDVRYFAPAMEVPFCGHATIASGVHLGRTRGAGAYALHTPAGLVALDVADDADGRTTAALTSVAPHDEVADDDLVEAVLAAFGWTADDLDPSLGPPAVAFAGARHLVLFVADRATLATMAYDDTLLPAMRAADLVTVQLAHRTADPAVWDVRDPFPTGGVVEDPATGAAAAALGGLLRARGLVDAPADLLLRQGDDMGRPSRLAVHVPERGGIVVRGTAVALP